MLGLVDIGVAHGVREAREVVGQLAAVVHLEGLALPRRGNHAAAPLNLQWGAVQINTTSTDCYGGTKLKSFHKS